MRATRRAARDDPDPQIHAKETILHLLRLLFSQYPPHNNLLALRFAYKRTQIYPTKSGLILEQVLTAGLTAVF